MATDVDCTCSALRMSARRLSRACDAALAPEILTVSQYAVPGNLAERGAEGQPASGVPAEALGLHRTALAEAGRSRRERRPSPWRAPRARFDQGFGAEAATGAEGE